MTFNITYNGRTTLAVDYAGAVELGYPVDVIGAAMKVSAKVQIADVADGYRADLASGSAGKLAEYRFKEEIAHDPDNASDAELALISREAKARGITRTKLINQINVQAAAYRQIALLIGVLEAEAGAAITVIADDAADIEAQIQTVLSASQTQAETAFAEAQALISG